ncbi:MAG: DUF3299 domain-containing protein [Gammaproteobacteria bacterium]|nr:DUF3299 domain-containing protein [Gammaproteobacteria bacterium]
MSFFFQLLIILLSALLLTGCDSSSTDTTQTKFVSENQVSNSNMTHQPIFKEVEWIDLVPDNYRPDEVLADYFKKYDLDNLEDSDPIVLELQQKLKELLASSPVNEQIDGQNIKLAGYILPLEYDGMSTSEFLLVPYFGACIHTPPPPANQTVYVKTEKPIEIDGLYDAVWVSGEIKIEHKVSEYTDSGYLMLAKTIEEYIEVEKEE